jgi:hypothetical protein
VWTVEWSPLASSLVRVRSRPSLELELIALRHQVTVLRRRRLGRPQLSSLDRLLWMWLYRIWPQVIDAMVLVKPATVIRWQRKGNGDSGRSIGLLQLFGWSITFFYHLCNGIRWTWIRCTRPSTEFDDSRRSRPGQQSRNCYTSLTS